MERVHLPVFVSNHRAAVTFARNVFFFPIDWEMVMICGLEGEMGMICGWEMGMICGWEMGMICGLEMGNGDDLWAGAAISQRTFVIYCHWLEAWRAHSTKREKRIIFA